ncbi:MAG: cell wall hydrolase [Lachnospiraceae bacterium]|nr:cell wall hydrolase [Lachnospiraceae bacterium]MDD7377979.1 cell wall hydrolase [Lachnospiraceae bacterium]MDY4616961.1 cell wall hydrolase [Lachnospiraceae bacterium]
MKPDKKVLESAVLGLALVLVTTYTAVAAPKQEAAGDSQMRVTSNGTAGAASQLVSGLDDTQTASIEKTDVEVVTAPQMSEEEAAWQNRLMANVEESLNVRTEPNEAAALAGKLRKGDVAEVVERMDGWTHITSGNVDGYVKDEFCVFGQEAYAYAKANCTTKATVLEAGLRLRSEANEASSIYDVVAQGDTLTVAADMEVPEGWVAIQYGDGIAYVSAQYVEVALSTGTGITVEEELAIIAKQKAEEEAKKAEQAQKAATTQKAAVEASYDEVTILGALIQLEAGNECYDGQVAVGAVVMNRVRSGSYPNSISDVVYQRGQFSVRDRVAGVAAGGVKSSCLQAAQQAINGTDNTGGALQFAPVSSGRGGVVIGNHVFY